MPHNQLSQRAIEALKHRGRYSDGGGLVLQISKWGTKAWVFRYSFDGHERHMGLGPLGSVSLAKARELARGCRALVRDGLDPIERHRAQRHQRELERARHVTFQEHAQAYAVAHRAGWRSAKHSREWSATLSRFVFPTIGHLSVASIDTALVLKCLEPIWGKTPETAKRVRGRIENVLDSATARGLRQGENPARWRGHLDKLLPARSKVRAVEHLPAMPYAALPQFMAALRSREGDVGARALELTILTGLRTGEVIGAKASEIDFPAKVWTIPAARTKRHREHRVPLSRRAIEILSGLSARGDEPLFPGRGRGQLSKWAMLRTLGLMGHGDVTVHGFRSTFRDWAGETTAYPNHVIEMALAHVIGNAVEAAYRRGDLFDKRRRLMNAWAEYCVTAPAGEVIPLRSGSY